MDTPKNWYICNIQCAANRLNMTANATWRSIEAFHSSVNTATRHSPANSQLYRLFFITIIQEDNFWFDSYSNLICENADNTFFIYINSTPSNIIQLGKLKKKFNLTFY